MTVLEWWHTGLAALVVGFLLWLTLSRRNGQIGLPPFRRTTSDPPIRNACAVVSRTVDTERLRSHREPRNLVRISRR